MRKFIGRPVLTIEATDPPELVQAFSLTENTILRAARSLVIEYNNPTYTAISMKLYGYRSGPTVEIAESTNSWAAADVSTLAHAYKELYFTFDDVPLAAGITYCVGLVFTGYTGSQASHLTWASEWPTPVYQEGLTILQTDAANMPLSLSILGAKQ